MFPESYRVSTCRSVRIIMFNGGTVCDRSLPQQFLSQATLSSLVRPIKAKDLHSPSNRVYQIASGGGSLEACAYPNPPYRIGPDAFSWPLCLLTLRNNNLERSSRFLDCHNNAFFHTRHPFFLFGTRFEIGLKQLLHIHSVTSRQRRESLIPVRLLLSASSPTSLFH